MVFGSTHFNKRQIRPLISQMQRILKSHLLQGLLGLFPRAQKRRLRVKRALVRDLSAQNDSQLEIIWTTLVDRYFPEKKPVLMSYLIKWSARRQRRTLGSCNITKQKVTIARELSHEEFLRWVEPVLYHELCHAALGLEVPKSRGRRAWHGSDFRALEAKHPEISALNTWIKSGGWGHAVRVDRARRRGSRRSF